MFAFASSNPADKNPGSRSGDFSAVAGVMSFANYLDVTRLKL